MAASEIEQWWIDKFQENLGPIRKVAGWTTQQLADELGVARQTVSNLETGKRWQRCRQRRHRETQAQCRNIEGFKDCRNGQAYAQHGDAGSCRHHRSTGQWNRRRHHHLLDVPGRRPEQALSRRNIETDWTTQFEALSTILSVSHQRFPHYQLFRVA